MINEVDEYPTKYRTFEEAQEISQNRSGITETNTPKREENAQSGLLMS